MRILITDKHFEDPDIERKAAGAGAARGIVSYHDRPREDPVGQWRYH